jgi:hypothetical protein
MRRSVYTDAPVTNDCVIIASHRVIDLDDFKSVDGKTVPELSDLNRKITRYFFVRDNEYVLLDLYHDNDPSFKIHFGHVDYGFSPSKGVIKRKRLLLEEIMQAVLESCGISEEQIEVTQECQNVKCELKGT